jgi:hypothetical protein
MELHHPEHPIPKKSRPDGRRSIWRSATSNQSGFAKSRPVSALDGGIRGESS